LGNWKNSHLFEIICSEIFIFVWKHFRVFWKQFRFVLENILECAEKNCLHEKFPINVVKHFGKFWMFGNISECYEKIVSMVPNKIFWIIETHLSRIILVWNIYVCLETFQSVLKYFRFVWEHLRVCWKKYLHEKFPINIVKHFGKFWMFKNFVSNKHFRLFWEIIHTKMLLINELISKLNIIIMMRSLK